MYIIAGAKIPTRVNVDEIANGQKFVAKESWDI